MKNYILNAIRKGNDYTVKNYKGKRTWQLVLTFENGNYVIYDKYWQQNVNDFGGVEGLIDAILSKQVKGKIELLNKWGGKMKDIYELTELELLELAQKTIEELIEKTQFNLETSKDKKDFNTLITISQQLKEMGK